MAKFKKGDRVKIVGNPQGSASNCKAKLGSIVYVLQSNSTNPYVGWNENDKSGTPENDCCLGFVNEDYLELITDYQPITPKVGEKYRVLKPLLGGVDKAEARGLPEIITLGESRRGFPYFTCKEHGWYFHGDCLTTEYLELVEDEPNRSFKTSDADFIPFDQHQTIEKFRLYVDQYYEKEPNQTLLTKTKNYMTNLYRRAKLSANEKVLLKAGYINDDGTPTTKGSEASNFLQFKANEAELVKMAEADLAEEDE